MDCLNNLSGCELVSLAAILAVTISQNISSDEADILGNFFSSLGSNLSTIALTMPDTQNTQAKNDTEKEC